MNEKLKITPVTYYPECPTCPLQSKALQDAEKTIAQLTPEQQKAVTASIYCHSVNSWNRIYMSGYTIDTLGFRETGGGQTSPCPHFLTHLPVL